MDRANYEQRIKTSISRRRLLGLTGTVAISFACRPVRAAGPAPGTLMRRPNFSTSPFQLSVASGDPMPDGVVLWTRLVADPTDTASMGPDLIDVGWEIANDDAFADVVQSGTAIADPLFAHSVHVDAKGLNPGSEYFYRFTAGSEVSPVGRTKTAPAPDVDLARLRFAFVSCANYEHGFFNAYRHLSATENDVILCLGDYLYEYASSSTDFAAEGGPVRHVTGGDIVTLEEYRARHALYKADPDLQAAHLSAPWIVTWDDHEVENDYAGTESGRGESPEVFQARKAAAYQAYYEHMPLRIESMPDTPNWRLYRRLRFGNLVEFNVLDTRRYRSPHPCQGVSPRCDAALDPAVTMTGVEQEEWLIDGLSGSTAKWKSIAQQVMMSQLNVGLFDDQFNNDQWDGYPLARNRILGAVADSNTENVVVLTGDIHSAWAGDLKADFASEDSPIVASEFVCTSVTSFNPFASQLGLVRALNPALHYFDGRHGYCSVEVTPELWSTEFRVVNTVAERNQTAETVATWVVEAGKAGLAR